MLFLYDLYNTPQKLDHCLKWIFLRLFYQFNGEKYKMQKRRRFKSEFKARMALEAIRGEITLNELASEYDIHPNQISQWKKQLLDSAHEVFLNGKPKNNRSEDALKDMLYQEIGKLKIELEFLKKKVLR
jgi:transposase-like protein